MKDRIMKWKYPCALAFYVSSLDVATNGDFSCKFLIIQYIQIFKFQANRFKGLVQTDRQTSIILGCENSSQFSHNGLPPPPLPPSSGVWLMGPQRAELAQRKLLFSRWGHREARFFRISIWLKKSNSLWSTVHWRWMCIDLNWMVSNKNTSLVLFVIVHHSKPMCDVAYISTKSNAFRQLF